MTGGNFIDLCLRGFYDNFPIRSEPFEYDHSLVNRYISIYVLLYMHSFIYI
jgi:hypothetical protein